MGDDKVLKGVFKDGALIASVIQKEGLARIMLKGAEPGDGAFAGALAKAAAACKEYVAAFEARELCAVVAQPAGAETVEVAPGPLGLTRVTIMDADCGQVIRAFEDEPAPMQLPYSSLKQDTRALPNQPGMATIPADIPRKIYRELSEPQRQVFSAAAQIAGRGLLRITCVEDEGLRLVVVVRDMPPPRARSAIVPLGALADELAKGTPLDEIAKRLRALA